MAHIFKINDLIFQNKLKKKVLDFYHYSIES